MISFQMMPSGKEIQIDIDDEGIDALVEALRKLRGSGSHTHLRAPSVGGRDLSDQTPWGKAAIGEVIIAHGGD